MTDLHERLLQLGEDERRQRKLTSDLQHIETELRQHEQRAEELGRELQKEGRDVQKLEGLSLTSLFRTLLGDRIEQLDKERQEFLAAKLRYDAELEAAQPLKDDAERCRSELAAFDDLEQRRVALLDEREQQLRQAGTAAGRQLADLAGRLADVRSDQREIDEAIEAARRALSALAEAGDKLRSARGWGQFDLLGGGLITTSIKHSHIDAARGAAGRAQRHLHRLHRELQDLGGGSSGLAIEIGGFDKFADFFLDGLIFDWIVQSKIVRTQERVQDTALRVREIVRQLERLRGDRIQQQEQLEAERERLLTEP